MPKSKVGIMTCTCRLPNLVESHDVAGLQKAMDDPDLTSCFTYPCHFQPGQNKQMRDVILENQSAVERACVLGHLDMLELFLANGCSANLPTSHGRLIHTVLISLKSNRHLIDSGKALQVIKLMLRMDCDVDVKDYQGRSPVMIASELADPAIMKEILEHCLDWQLYTANKDNHHTPLQMVCMNGSVQCVLLLLEYLAIKNLSIEASHGMTPLICSFLVLGNNLHFHTLEWWNDHKLLQVQYNHIAIIEILYEAMTSNDKCMTHRQCNFLPGVASRTAIFMALEVAERFEVMMFNLAAYEKLPDSECSESEDPEHLKENNAKAIQSPYAKLVRMLVCVFNINPFTSEEKSDMMKRLPSIKSLVMEMFEFTCSQKRVQHLPPSLLHQARNVVHLRMAKCNKLCLMDQLPLPRKLKDFVKFCDF